MSETHRNYFNEKAPIWDQLMSHRDPQHIANIIKGLGIQEGSTILDVGTGTGIVLPFLKKKLALVEKLLPLILRKKCFNWQEKKTEMRSLNI